MCFLLGDDGQDAAVRFVVCVSAFFRGLVEIIYCIVVVVEVAYFFNNPKSLKKGRERGERSKF